MENHPLFNGPFPEYEGLAIQLDAHVSEWLENYCGEADIEPADAVESAIIWELMTKSRPKPEGLDPLHDRLTITGDGTRQEKAFLYEMLHLAGTQCDCTFGACSGGVLTIEEARSLVLQAYLYCRIGEEYIARHLST